MRYLEIKIGPWSKEPLPWWCRILKKIIPAANPDLEEYYTRTRTWWLEVNEDGLPQREIGFAADMSPIVLGPIGSNFGFLVDSSDDWKNSTEDSPQAARDFQKTWELLWPKFMHLEKRNSHPTAAANGRHALTRAARG